MARPGGGDRFIFFLSGWTECDVQGMIWTRSLDATWREGCGGSRRRSPAQMLSCFATAIGAVPAPIAHGLPRPASSGGCRGPLAGKG